MPVSAATRSVCLVLLASTCTLAAEPSPQSVLTAVQRSVPGATVVTPTGDPATFFAGDFSVSPEVARRAGSPMGGNNLYLLPDRTYYYLSWTDISPLSMEDKGRWHFDGRFVRTESDHTIRRGTPFHDHAFAPLYVKIAGGKSLCLLEISQDFPRFVKVAKAGDDFTFLLFARVRIKTVTDAAAVRAKIRKDTGPAASAK